jgi:hypothetical protein
MDEGTLALLFRRYRELDANAEDLLAEESDYNCYTHDFDEGNVVD